MRKFTQRELIQEGFWDTFKAAVAGGAEVARKIAPEITDPLDKFGDWASGVKDKMDNVASPLKAVEKFLEDNGLILMKGTKIIKSDDKTKGGHINFIAKVDELGYDVKGRPIAGYQYPKHNNIAIVQMDKKKKLSMLRRPRKDTARQVGGSNQPSTP